MLIQEQHEQRHAYHEQRHTASPLRFICRGHPDVRALRDKPKQALLKTHCFRKATSNGKYAALSMTCQFDRPFTTAKMSPPQSQVICRQKRGQSTKRVKPRILLAWGARTPFEAQESRREERRDRWYQAPRKSVCRNTSIVSHSSFHASYG